jgi:predicted phosphohydrolase
MRCTVISDTHNQHRRIRFFGEHDHSEMIIHAGDWTTRDKSHYDFLDWYSDLPYKYKILVAGNHDYLVEEIGYESFRQTCHELGIIYLEDTSVEIEGFKIHGSPWTPNFGSYSFMDDDFMLDRYWQKIPLDTDILVTHGPRHGSGDKVAHTYSMSPHVGSKTLWYRMLHDLNIKYHFYGHIHEAYGIDKDCDYVSCNASTFNYFLDGIMNPFTFELSK